MSPLAAARGDASLKVLLGPSQTGGAGSWGQPAPSLLVLPSGRLRAGTHL